jgi:predicted transcriptional regulator
MMELDGDKIKIILEVLRSVEPAPMSFKYFFPDPSELANDLEHGISAWLLKQGYIKLSESDPSVFSITAKGIQFINGSRTPSGSLTEAYEISDEKVMMSFQPGSWPYRNEGLWTSLVKDNANVQPGLPIITFGEDTKDKLQNYPLTERNKELIPALTEIAEANLRNIEVQIKDENIGVLFIHGHYYASEKLLDKEFMLSLHKRMNAEVLAASIPRKGVLFVSNDMPGLDNFKLITEMEYEKNKDEKPLSSSIFMVHQGRVQGTMWWKIKE